MSLYQAIVKIKSELQDVTQNYLFYFRVSSGNGFPYKLILPTSVEHKIIYIKYILEILNQIKVNDRFFKFFWWTVSLKFRWKSFHYLLTLMLFQTCMMFFCGGRLCVLYTHKYMRNTNIFTYTQAQWQWGEKNTPINWGQTKSGICYGMEGITAVIASHWLGLDPED